MKIAIITDYLGRLGSKQKSTGYRQGMDLDLIENLLTQKEYTIRIYSYSNCLDLLKELEVFYVVYNSSEDPGEFYKSYIEDHIRCIALSHHICVPNEIFLRAHNNKVFMEMLRSRFNFSDTKLFESQYIGTINEFLKLDLVYPVVMKGASGALSRNVKLVKTKKEGISTFKKLVTKVSISYRLKELVRRLRHKNNYRHEAIERGKVIVQKYIPDIRFDWKVLIYYDTVFILKRNNRPNDFRASGSGLFAYEDEIANEILDLAWETRIKLDVPHLSLDIAITNTEPIIFEFQVLGFGTKTMEFAPFYFKKSTEGWSKKKDPITLEKIYVDSLDHFLRERYHGQ